MGKSESIKILQSHLKRNLTFFSFSGDGTEYKSVNCHTQELICDINLENNLKSCKIKNYVNFFKDVGRGIDK